MENYTNPSIRFPEFTQKWKLKKLGELFRNRRQKGNENLVIYSVTQDRGLVPRGSLDRTMSNDAKAQDNLYVEVNDLVYNMMRMWQGAIGLAYHRCMVSPAYIVLQPLENVNSTFYLYFFERTRSKYLFTAYSYGLTNDRLRLYYKDFASIKFFSPTLSEQQKISSFLSTVDTKLQALKKKKALLEQYKKGVMQKIFSQELRFTDEHGNPFPDWEKKKLGDIAKRKVLKNKDNQVTLVFTNSASQGIVNQRDFFDKDIANQGNLLNYYIVEKDDFIYNPRISNLAPVGPISRNHLGTGVMSPLYSVFKVIHGNLDFYELFFNTTLWHEYLNSIANFGARFDRMNITTKDFYLMPLPFPSIEEQTKIANFLLAINQKIDKVGIQIQQTEQWKKGLLQKMFI